MDSIITYLFLYNQYLFKIISQLILFIAKYIPLKQWAFEDSHSPEYQKFKVDKLPKIIRFEKVDYQLLLAYYKHKYNKLIKPVKRRKVNSIPENIVCPRCGAPHHYIYDNNGNRGHSFSVKFVARISMKAIMLTNPWYFSVLIADILFHPEKTENTFAYINVLIPGAPTIKTILPNYLKTWMPPISTSISFTTYTVNSQ